MGEIFTAAGSVAAAGIAANAMQEATDAQIEALERQKEFVYNNLDPSVISPQATQADVSRALNRLALQGYVDPTLLAQRYASESAIASQAAQVGAPGSAADLVARSSAGEALMEPGVAAQAKQKLIDAALGELAQGATLPSDVQAELVKAGLEQSGMVTGAASPKGTGGQILRKLIGTAGLELQQKRQQQAAGLLSQAQNLETSRQNILQNLFPNLSRVQLANLQAQQGVLSQANQMVPESGLSGTDIANIWMARVGATNQLAQSAADAAARGGMGQAQVWGNALGSATGAIGSALPSMSQISWPSWGGGGGGGGGNPSFSEQDMIDMGYWA